VSPTDTTATVSVVIPTCNRADLVLRALASVRAQTRPPSEILVVDDGSTDATIERIRAAFPEVTLLEQKNSGVSAARNTGIQKARGTFIALLDSDDEWLPQKLDRQLAAIEKANDNDNDNDTLLCHTDEIWIRGGRRVNPMKKHQKYGGRIFERCLPLCVISPSSVLLHRSLFETIGLFDEDLPVCEDYDLWLRVTARYPVLYLNEPLIVKYGGHADQLSHKYWGMDRFRITALQKILASGELGEPEQAAAEAMLLNKIAIYARGARKRGKHAEADGYEQRLAR
jgi:glycosyltransferase involved in cell wall biosynthesis